MRPSGSLVSKSCIFKYTCKLVLVSIHVRTRRSYDPTLLKKNNNPTVFSCREKRTNVFISTCILSSFHVCEVKNNKAVFFLWRIGMFCTGCGDFYVECVDSNSPCSNTAGAFTVVERRHALFSSLSCV